MNERTVSPSARVRAARSPPQTRAPRSWHRGIARPDRYVCFGVHEWRCRHRRRRGRLVGRRRGDAMIQARSRRAPLPAAPFRLPWMKLLARVFRVDILLYSRCCGPMRVTRALTTPQDIAAEDRGARAAAPSLSCRTTPALLGITRSPLSLALPARRLPTALVSASHSHGPRARRPFFGRRVTADHAASPGRKPHADLEHRIVS